MITIPRTAWFAIGGIFSVATLVAGTGSAWSAFHRLLGEQLERHTETHAATGGRVEIVGLRSGKLTLRRGTAGEVRVERELTWTNAKPIANERWTGTALEIDTICPERLPGDSCSVSYVIWVPPTAAVVAATNSGNLTALELDGDLSLDTTSGNVSVSGGRGKLALRSSSGNISVGGSHAPETTVDTSSGNVSLKYLSGPTAVTVDTSSGNVTIFVPRGGSYRVEGDSGSGRRSVEVPRDPTARARIAADTGSGNVTIHAS